MGGKLFVGQWGVDHLRFGVSRTERKKSRDLVNNTLSGGADYYSEDNAINVGDLGGGVLSHTLTPPNFMSGVNSNFPHSFLAFDVPNYLAQLQAYNGNLRPDGTAYDYAMAAPAWNPLQSYRVSEKTNAFYLQADMSGDRWDGDIGVRLVKTNTNAQAWDAKILSITENGAFNYTAQYAAPTPIVQDADYTFLLPSANFTWHFTDELQLRAGAAKTMARPPVDRLAPTNTTESVAWGEFTQVYGGNVDLKPYSAAQGDLSLEWYFAEHSIANVAVFYKRIKNQITTSWEPGQDIGVPGYLFNVMRPINGDYAKVKGLEVGFQHFWKSGLGVRAQYTRNLSQQLGGWRGAPARGHRSGHLFAGRDVREGQMVAGCQCGSYRWLRHRHQRAGYRLQRTGRCAHLVDRARVLPGQRHVQHQPRRTEPAGRGADLQHQRQPAAVTGLLPVWPVVQPGGGFPVLGACRAVSRRQSAPRRTAGWGERRLG